MDNGVEKIGEELRSEEMREAAVDETLQLESVDGDVVDSHESKDDGKDSDENEVFEEASFHTPHYHEISDSRAVAFGGRESAEVSQAENGDLSLDHAAEKFHELTQVQSNDHNPDEQEEGVTEKIDEPTKVQVSDQILEEQCSDAFHKPTDAQINDPSREGEDLVVSEKPDRLFDASVSAQSPKEEEQQEEVPVVSEEKIEACDESDHAVEEKVGVMPTKSNGIDAGTVIADGNFLSLPVVDGERVQDEENALVGEKPENGEYRGAISDGAHDFAHEKSENGDSLGATKELRYDMAAETEEQIPHDQGVEKRPDVLIGLDTISCGEEFEADNGIQAAAKEPPTPNLGVEERLSSVNDSKPSEEFGKETVLMEDLGESSSSDDDDENKTFSRPAPSASSDPKNLGGPSLPAHPAGLGPSAPLLEPAPRALHQPRANGAVPQQHSAPSEEPTNDDSEENDETREKLQMIRVKFLRLAHRLGQTPHNVVVAQVLYRLGLAEQLRRNTNRLGVFSFDRASVMAEQLEAGGQEPLDFSCTIMVIGKTGVGKSATINSIFDEVKFRTDAFQLATKKVQDIVGSVQGIKVRVIDTPGLFTSSLDQQRNEKILHSVKRFIKKTPPDIVLYFDRLDMQSRDYGDVPLLRTITNVFGASIWFNAIVVLTHAASAPPDGVNGSPLSYEMFVTQRSHVVQQAIRQAAGDVRLMNPVSLVENHSACRTNRAGQRVLPNGQVWKPQLLLLSFASKILAEANMLLKLQDNPPKPSGFRARVPPLPFLLSSLLQSRPQLKLPEDQLGEDDAMDEDLDAASDSDEGSDYDELPPFKRLNKAQLAKLSKAQRKAYFEELDYREKLFMKKQLKEDKMRRRLMKKMAEEAKDLPDDYNSENIEDESSGPASVPVPMPDLVLPTSFDSDNPSHRYRFLDSANQWLVRPVLETQGWDHDVGYEGLNVERLFVVKQKIPVSVSGQLTKDKKECTFQMEIASSLKHSEGKATSLALDMQTVGKDMAYTLRGETKFNNFRRNSTAAGISATFLGDAMSAGVKIEDKLIVNKRFRVLMSGGAMTGRGDVAYGGRLEATLRDKDYPIGRALSTLALSVVDWHGDLAVGCNVQSQIPIGRGTNVIGHANLSNRGSGQIGIRLNSSEQLQIALLAFVPIFRNAKRMLFGPEFD